MRTNLDERQAASSCDANLDETIAENPSVSVVPMTVRLSIGSEQFSGADCPQWVDETTSEDPAPRAAFRDEYRTEDTATRVTEVRQETTDDD